MKNWLPPVSLPESAIPTAPAAVGPLPDLAAEGVAGPAVAVASRAAPLHDEAGLDAVEGESVVEAAAREVEE